VTSDFSGFVNFAVQWQSIARELISEEPTKWDTLKAPKGPLREILQIETAAYFITAAARAVASNKVYERALLMPEYLKAELWPFGLTPDDLKSRPRELAVKRINKSLADDMEVFLFFGLFELVKHQDYAYRITEKGERYYEQLKAGPSDNSGTGSNGSDDTGR
jgi:hypothetical protein